MVREGDTLSKRTGKWTSSIPHNSIKKSCSHSIRRKRVSYFKQIV